MRVGLVGVAGLLLSAQAALPDAVARARALYERSDFSQAIAAADQALTREKQASARGELHLVRALCFSALRKPAETHDAIDTALGEDPLLADDPAFAPSFVALLQQARVRLAGQLHVSSPLQGAGVRIDGVVVGPAPVSQPLPVGRHVVEVLDARGLVRAQRTLVMTVKGSQALTLEAEPVIAVDAGLVEAPSAAALSPTSLPVSPFLGGRLVVDPSCPACGLGLTSEASVGLIGRLWTAEAGVLFAKSLAGTLRGGPRLSFASGVVAVQLTVDGVLFFERPLVPGVGASLGATWHFLTFVELFVEASLRFHWAPMDVRAGAGLVAAGVRVRLPSTRVP